MKRVVLLFAVCWMPVAAHAEGGCQSDSDCKHGRVCQESRCVASGECTRDTDCPGDEICTADRCVPPTTGVTTDANRPTSESAPVVDAKRSVFAAEFAGSLGSTVAKVYGSSSLYPSFDTDVFAALGVRLRGETALMGLLDLQLQYFVYYYSRGFSLAVTPGASLRFPLGSRSTLMIGLGGQLPQVENAPIGPTLLVGWFLRLRDSGLGLRFGARATTGFDGSNATIAPSVSIGLGYQL